MRYWFSTLRRAVGGARRARRYGSAKWTAVESVERRILLTDVSGHITASTTWSITTEPYVVSGDLYIDPGVTLTIAPNVTVRTDYFLNEITVNGTIDASGVSFTGAETEIIVRNAGRLNLKSGSAVSGNEVKYESGSLGTILNTQFNTAKLRIESSAIVVDGSTFSRVDPVYTNPAYVPQLYDNTFQNDATVFVYGTMAASATWQKITNLSHYRVDGDITINTGVTLTIPSGIEILTDYFLNEITVNGTIDASGVSFTGAETEIIVRNAGRLNLKSGSAVSGNEVKYEAGSLGTIQNTQFNTAKLRLESGSVTVDGSMFSRVDPVYTNPAYVPQLFDNTFQNDATVFVYGTMAASATWQKVTNLSHYKVDGDITVNTGVTLTIPSGIEILTDYSLNEITVNGTIDASGVSFTGAETEIIVRNAGRLNLKSGSAVSGNEVKYESGSLGTILNAQFNTVKLRIESSAIVVDGCTFFRVDPVYTNPAYVPQLYDNTFQNDATVYVYGTMAASATWQKITNLSHYKVDGDITINTGVTLTIPSGIEILTDYFLNEITVNGTVDASGVAFSGAETEIVVRNAGRLNLKTGSSFAGNQLVFEAGSLGDVTNTTFNADFVINSLGVHQISQNSFLSGTVKARGTKTDTIDLRSSYWGTQSASEIALRIEDRIDNANLPLILFDPFLTDPPDNGVSILNLEATDATRAEGNSGTTPFTFRVVRSGSLNSAVDVSWTVSGTGSQPATAADFGGTFPSGTVHLNSGDTSKTVTVFVTGDQTAESSETFLVALGTPVGAGLGTGIASGTILDDDSAVVRQVTTIADSGTGSLRQALLDALAAPGPDIIQFAIGTGRQKIIPASPLPVISTAILLDATTQPGYAGVPLIELNGVNAGDTNGLEVTGGNSVLRGLAITGFARAGVRFEGGSGSVVEGCLIGTADGVNPAGNGQEGIVIRNSSANRVGGSESSLRNVVSGNSGFGIIVDGTSEANWIAGNLIGVGIGGQQPLKNGSSGVWLINGARRNQIGTNGDGILDSTEGNVISGNGFDGVAIEGLGTDSNVVAGNQIGTDAAGMTRVGGNFFGVLIKDGPKQNRIGTNGDGLSDTHEANTISGNLGAGIRITGAGTESNSVAGNFIGTNRTGTATIGNDWEGVVLDLGSRLNRVGTNGDGVADIAERNVISGNKSVAGLTIARAGTTDNLIAGNYIGTDVTGTIALGNAEHGISVFDQASGNRIGTNGDGQGDAAERNIISGNGWDGIFIGDSGTDSNVVAGNFIGVDASGINPLGNNYGVRIDNSARRNRIGTDGNGVADLAERNVISGNRNDGILLNAVGTSENTISGNAIGTDFNGQADLGNAFSGVAVIDASNNLIGGLTSAQGNLIHHNRFDGVAILSGTGNRILGNSIDANHWLGIDLKPDGMTANDSGDADTGANDNQNFPVLSSVAVSGSTTRIRGFLNSVPSQTYRLEFFSSPAADASGNGEGRTFLDSRSLETGASGQINFDFLIPISLSVGSRVAATATSSGGSTSEFSGTSAVHFVPENLQLSAATIAENQPAPATIGTLTASDADNPNSLVYALSTGPGTDDNQYFTISGNLLQARVPFDFESRSVLTVTVQVTDGTGLTASSQFEIRVTDVAEAPAITSPAGPVYSLRPTFAWTAVPGSTDYEVWVGRSGNPAVYFRDFTTAHSYSPSVDFEIGTFTVFIRPRIAQISGTWSAGKTFSIITPAQLIAMARQQPTPRPTIAWNSLPGAMKYDVWIDDAARGIPQVVRKTDVTGTSFVPSTDLLFGNYRVWVRGIAADGTQGAWSAGQEFVAGPAPTPVSPVNSTFSARPEFRWTVPIGALTFGFQLRNRTTNAIITSQLSLSTASWTPSADLPTGNYRWWSIAAGPGNSWGVWSAPVDFSVGKTVLTAPIGSVATTRPLFRWQAVDGAVRYELWVTNTAGTLRAVTASGLIGTSFTPGFDLAKGGYRAWIRAFRSDGTASGWSDQAAFTVVDLSKPDSRLNELQLAGLATSLTDGVKSENPELLPADFRKPAPEDVSVEAAVDHRAALMAIRHSQPDMAANLDDHRLPPAAEAADLSKLPGLSRASDMALTDKLFAAGVL